MTAGPAHPRFELAADELRRQEFARLADAVTPRLEGLRSMTPAAFRVEIALKLERLGHTVITDPSAPDLVTKGRPQIHHRLRRADG